MELKRALEQLKQAQARLERREEELRRVTAELGEVRERINQLRRAEKQMADPDSKQRAPVARVTVLDLVSILVVSVAVGLLFNAANPNGVALLPDSLFRPAPPQVSVTEVRKSLAENGAVLVDARPAEFYREGHIQGAINLPPSLFDIIYRMKLSDLDPQRSIIVYGRTISRRYDEDVAHHLTQRDREDVKVFTGGLSAWAAEGYPVEP